MSKLLKQNTQSLKTLKVTKHINNTPKGIEFLPQTEPNVLDL